MKQWKDITKGFFGYRKLAGELGNEAVYEECNKILAGVAFAFSMMEMADGAAGDDGKSQLAHLGAGFLHKATWDELNAWLEEQRELGLLEESFELEE